MSLRGTPLIEYWVIWLLSEPVGIRISACELALRVRKQVLHLVFLPELMEVSKGLTSDLALALGSSVYTKSTNRSFG